MGFRHQSEQTMDLNFISREFKEYLQEYGILHKKTTPLWPQANGEIERQNSSLLKRLKIAQVEKRNWKEELLTYLMMYRATPHNVTGVSPSQMLFGRTIRTKLPELCQLNYGNIEIRDRDKENKEKGKMYADTRRKAQENDLQEGDLVLMKQKKTDKLSTNFNPSPMKIVSKGGNGVLMESPEGVMYRRNVTHLKKFIGEKPNSSSEDSGKIQSELVKSQNVFLNNGSVSNSEIVSNEVSSENVSVSNHCDLNQSVDESNVCDSHGNVSVAVENSGKFQPSPKSPETTVRTRPVRERKLPSRFKDFELR